MKTRRILSAALAALMLLPALAACSDSEPAGSNVTTAAPAVTAAPVETDAVTTEVPAPTVDLSHIPDSLDFWGRGDSLP